MAISGASLSAIFLSSALNPNISFSIRKSLKSPSPFAISANNSESDSKPGVILCCRFLRPTLTPSIPSTLSSPCSTFAAAPSIFAATISSVELINASLTISDSLITLLYAFIVGSAFAVAGTYSSFCISCNMSRARFTNSCLSILLVRPSCNNANNLFDVPLFINANISCSSGVIAALILSVVPNIDVAFIIVVSIAGASAGTIFLNNDPIISALTAICSTACSPYFPSIISFCLNKLDRTLSVASALRALSSNCCLLIPVMSANPSDIDCVVLNNSTILFLAGILNFVISPNWNNRFACWPIDA